MSKHYKLYKDGKHLVTAGIASLSVIGVLAVSSETIVHADTTNNSTSGTQQTATGGNAVTATTASTTSTNTFNPSSLATPMTNNQVAESKASTAGTITQPVNIDHSQLNNAVDQARQAGLTVNQQPTTTQTVNQDQVDAVKQNIQNDEAKQAQQIQTITRQHQTEVSNVNNFNGSKGDTSQLDAKVKEAQSIPGLTVVHDQDQTTVKKASDTQGIQEAVNNATKSNNDQAQSIQNAIDTQKRNNDEYQKSKAEWDKHYQEQLGHPLSATVTDKVYTYGGVSYTNSTTDVTISSNQTVLSKDQLDAEVQKDMAAWAHGSSNYWLIWNPSGTIEITWHNAAQDENGRKLNIVWTLSDIASLGKNVDNWMRGPYITIFNNPMDEIAWGNIAGLRVTENLVYADTGIKYDKPYYRSAGSLDAQPGAERYEFSSPISGVLGSFISSDSYINPTVQSVSGPAAQVASVMFAQSPNHKAFVGSDYDQAALTKFGITYLVNNGSTIAYGTSGTPGSGNGADGGNVVSPYATHIMGNTGLAMQAIYPPVKKTTEAHYHYNPAFFKTI